MIEWLAGVVIVAIIGWGVNKFLNGFFKKRKNEEVVALLEKRIDELGREKKELSESLQSHRETHEKEKSRIIQSLKRRGLSVEKLIDKYDRPLNAVLVSYATQKEEVSEGRYDESHFLKDELAKFNSKYLGGTDSLIPPAKVPPQVKTQKDLQAWFEKDILKGRFCKLKFLALIDLKKKSFWGTYLPYKQKKPKHFTIGEVLDVEDLFTEEQINRIALSEIIRNGDIAWLASSVLSGDELDHILKNQAPIEKELDNPSLRVLADDRLKDKLTTVLSQFVSNPDEVSDAIIDEAKFWNSRLLK